MLLCGLEAPLLLRHLMDGPFVSSAAFCPLRALVVEDVAGCAAACTSHGPAHAKSNQTKSLHCKDLPLPKVGSKT
jgi:hypothetical protein